MKRLLGVFGGSSHADHDDITALVDQARETSPGTAIVRRIEGTAAPQRLGAQASVAVYRVVQEALTNVRKYAGPRPTVRIDEHWDDDGLSLTIADNGRGASSGLDGHAPGYGLIGMRERVAAVGGTVNAGPGIGGGFVVSVTIPYAAAPDAADSAVGTSRSADVATAATQTAVPPSAVAPGIGPMTPDEGRAHAAAPTLAGAATARAANAVAGIDATGPVDASGTADSIDRQPPTSHTPRPPRFTMPSFPLPERIVPPSLQEIAGKLRSKPIDQAKSAGGGTVQLDRATLAMERAPLSDDGCHRYSAADSDGLLRSVRPRRFRQQPAVQPCTVYVHQRDGDRPVGLPSAVPGGHRGLSGGVLRLRDGCSCPARPGATCWCCMRCMRHRRMAGHARGYG